LRQRYQDLRLELHEPQTRNRSKNSSAVRSRRSRDNVPAELPHRQSVCLTASGIEHSAWVEIMQRFTPSSGPADSDLRTVGNVSS
jgi:hypothetical protein